MIERLQGIAIFLAYFRLLIIGLGIGFLTIFVLSLFENPWLEGDGWLIPALLGLCWSLTLYSFSQLFATVPARAADDANWRIKLSVVTRRGLLWVLALLMGCLSLALLVLSYELLRAWL